MRRIALIAVLCAFVAMPAQADITLPGTGLAGIGNAETNYSLSYAATPEGSQTPLPVHIVTGHTVWLGYTGPLGTNNFLSLSADLLGPVGYYFYKISFNIPGITGISGASWSTDDDGAIFLNGVPAVGTGTTKIVHTYVPFEITDGFNSASPNELVFRVYNGEFGNPNPTGLLVTDMTATVVPVPGAMLLGLLGLGAAGAKLRRRG